MARRGRQIVVKAARFGRRTPAFAKRSDPDHPHLVLDRQGHHIADPDAMMGVGDPDPVHSQKPAAAKLRRLAP